MTGPCNCDSPNPHMGPWHAIGCCALYARSATETQANEPRPCPYGGLGLTGDLTGIPNDRVFGARCSCGAHVTVVDGRIPFHRLGIDERPPDEACEPKGDA